MTKQAARLIADELAGLGYIERGRDPGILTDGMRLLSAIETRYGPTPW